ncbi:hypothetical protein FD755_023120 [Muntiacus reevesi]|uniref:Uncharacterized protein n=1 Tax=Muntiacus reevesi TaxID=9886 RepID=A0A5N3VZ32_MUNRE|nr:hypothetical protein FD755_023120 [Muntiacus reevesi]
MSGPVASAPARGHSQEGGSVLGLRTFLPPVGTPGEEVTVSVVEAVEDSGGRGGVLVDGDEAGIGRECQLLAEDVMEEVEVELEEKTVEEQGLERPRGPSERPAPNALQALTALQLEVSSLHEENRRAYHHLAWRSAILQGIPGFWAKTSVIPSSHLILCCSLLLLPTTLPSIRVFSNESTLHIRCSSSVSAIRVMPSAYLRLLTFLPAIVIPACASSSPVFLMIKDIFDTKRP